MASCIVRGARSYQVLHEVARHLPHEEAAEQVRVDVLRLVADGLRVLVGHFFATRRGIRSVEITCAELQTNPPRHPPTFTQLTQSGPVLEVRVLSLGRLVPFRDHAALGELVEDVVVNGGAEVLGPVGLVGGTSPLAVRVAVEPVELGSVRERLAVERDAVAQVGGCARACAWKTPIGSIGQSIMPGREYQPINPDKERVR